MGAGDRSPLLALLSCSSSPRPPSPRRPRLRQARPARPDPGRRTLRPAQSPPSEAPPHVVYGGEVTFDADQADADLRAKHYILRGHVRLHETDTTLRAGEVTFDGRAQRATAADALLTRGVFSLRAPEIDGTPDLDHGLQTAT